ncbi:MAG TPA: hypothetical protein VFH61_11200 [Thermoleophilia bacterium]|nr:hypothetical protein [Thermoleophilia bacterium]
MQQTVRQIVQAVQPSAADWAIVSAGDIVLERPACELTMGEMIDANLVDGYQHFRPGDDLYITIGMIHLRRPRD